METTKAQTLPGLLLERAHATPHRAALRFHAFGIWEQETWKSLADKTRAVGNGLAAIGVVKGDIVGLVAKNSPQWIMSDLAIQGLAAVTLAIDPGFSPGAIVTMLQTQGATTVIVGDQEQHDKVEESRHLLPRLRRIVVVETRGLRSIERTAPGVDHEVLTWRQLLELAASAPDTWEGSVSAINGAEPATVEGVVDRNPESGDLRLRAHTLSSRDLLEAAEDLGSRLGAHAGDELHPIASFADPIERTLSETLALRVGAIMNIGEGGELLALEARDIQPSIAHVPAERLRQIRGEVTDRRARRGIRRFALNRILTRSGTVSRSSTRDLVVMWSSLSALAVFATVIHRTMVDQSGLLRLLIIAAVGAVVFAGLIGGGFAVRPFVRKAYGLARAHSLLTNPDIDIETVRFLGALHLNPILEHRTLNTQGADR
jgi:hypothetical protein